MWVEANLAMKVTPRHFLYNIEIKEVLNICLIIFFYTSNKINVNNDNDKIEISLTGGVMENRGILLVFLSIGAAPSSGGHFLNHAKTD